MQAKLLSKRDTNDLVEKLASTKRSNDAKILMKVKEVPHTGERGLLDAKKAVKLPRVVTMEEHIYNHMMARYGVLSLAMEHAAIFVMSLEAWAFGAPVSLDHESATKNGIGSVFGFSHTSHVNAELDLIKGDPLLRTFFHIVTNAVEEEFYWEQKSLLESIHDLLLNDIRRSMPYKDRYTQNLMLLKKLDSWLSESEFAGIVHVLFWGRRSEEQCKYTSQRSSF